MRSCLSLDGVPRLAARSPAPASRPQNVDQLHQRAGSPADRVLELHGNMIEAVCIDCDARTTTQQALDRLAAGDDDPR